MGRIAQGTKILAEGGYEKVFRQTFETVPEEQLQNSYACYLSTSAGPVMGMLYVSSAKLAYCSDSPLSYKSGGQTEWSYYKVGRHSPVLLNHAWFTVLWNIPINWSLFFLTNLTKDTIKLLSTLTRCLITLYGHIHFSRLFSALIMIYTVNKFIPELESSTTQRKQLHLFGDEFIRRSIYVFYTFRVAVCQS